MDVEIEYNFKEGTKSIIRIDTGELVESKKLRPEEYQTDLIDNIEGTNNG